MGAFLHRYGAEIGRLTFEHLWLTLSAMLWAALIGLPLGVMLTRRQSLARPVLAVSIRGRERGLSRSGGLAEGGRQGVAADLGGRGRDGPLVALAQRDLLQEQRHHERAEH